MGKVSSRVKCLILLCVVWAASCRARYTYQVPEQVDDGWQTASLQEGGLDGKLISQAISRVLDGTYQNVHSILIVKDGKLVLEEYFSGHAWSYTAAEHKGAFVDFDADTRHNLASVTKSFTSALVGIALDRGDIQSLDASVFDFFPEHADLRDEAKSKITLRHLLTMSSGLEWNEGEYDYTDRRNDLIQLFYVADPVRYILSKPAVAAPGKKWYYSGGDTNLLGEILKKATGQRMDFYAEEHLFAPLGISSYEWDHINADVIHASGNLQLRPRDMAKFGYLYLNDGAWQGQQVVPKTWTQESVKGHVALPRQRYGYQWWVRTYRPAGMSVDAFSAAGWGGQRIAVFPDLDMVVVFTGGNYVGPTPVDEILERYVLPAARW